MKKRSYPNILFLIFEEIASAERFEMAVAGTDPCSPYYHHYYTQWLEAASNAQNFIQMEEDASPKYIKQYKDQVKRRLHADLWDKYRNIHLPLT